MWEVRWDRGFDRLEPPVVAGRLNLARSQEASNQDGWTGDIRIEKVADPFVLRSMRVQGEHFVATFANSKGWGTELQGWIREGQRLVGEMRSTYPRMPPTEWSPIGGRRAPDAALMPFAQTGSLPKSTVEAAGLHQATVDALIASAEREHSTALVVLKGGKVVIERYQGDPAKVGTVRAMSASKSIVTLAIGRLIQDGKLTLDARLGALLPDWSQSDKRDITIRHLLNHTSGIDTTRVRAGKGRIASHAFASARIAPPGAHYLYNNNAVDLLAVVVRHVAGVQLDEYLQCEFFAKMQIEGANWLTDADGVPMAAGELELRPIDLAKIGQLMLQGGVWQGERLLPESWIQQLTAQGQPFVGNSGLLWWREGRFVPVLNEAVLAQWREAGVGAHVIAKARTLVDRKFQNLNAYVKALRTAIGQAEVLRLQETSVHGTKLRLYASTEATPIHGYSARGWLGQFLVVIPEHDLVAVRMRRAAGADYRQKGATENGYREFPADVWRLAQTPR